MENQPITGASLLLQAMRSSSVDTVFSLSGNQIMPVYDACIDTDVRIVHTRHESSAVFMADAYAQLTGQPGVALVTAAPGFANALGALYSAKMAESPVILLSGDSPLAQDGKFAFQEFDQVKAASAFVKLSVRLQSTDDINEIWQQAMSVAMSATPGPVHIALPADVLLAEHKPGQQVAEAVSSSETCGSPGVLGAASLSDLDTLADKLAAANSPIVFVSPQLNATRQSQLRQQLSKSLQVPVVAMESPRGLNDPALGNIKSLCLQADLVVMHSLVPVSFLYK